jgi:hypothetical protein
VSGMFNNNFPEVVTLRYWGNQFRCKERWSLLNFLIYLDWYQWPRYMSDWHNKLGLKSFITTNTHWAHHLALTCGIFFHWLFI